MMVKVSFMKSEEKAMSLNIFECLFLDQYSEGLINEKFAQKYCWELIVPVVIELRSMCLIRHSSLKY